MISNLGIHEAGGKELKKVLLLQSYHSGYKWTDDIDRAIKAKLTREIGVDLRIEYLDTKRYYSDHFLALLKESLSRKYIHERFSAVICVDNNALNFVIANRNTLFENVPVVFCGVNFYKPEMLKGQKGITGINEHFNALETIELMRRVHPTSKRIIVVNDATTTGTILNQEIKGYRDSYPDVVWVYTDDYTFEELERLSRSLSSGDLVLHSLFLRDSNGNFLEYDEAVEAITKNTTVPVYSLWDFNLGHGVVGGLMISGRYQGEKAAELTLQILQGIAADDIPVVMESPNHYFADFSVMEQLQIDPDLFPPTTTFINRPPRLYDTYKVQIWLVFTVIAVLLITSLLLLAANTKRKVAEKRLLNLTVELDDRVKLRTQELSKANEEIRSREEQISHLLANLSGMVYRCRNDESWTMEYVSEAVLELTGYRAEEVIGNQQISFADLIDERDQDVVRQAVDTAIAEKTSYTIEYRIITRDNHIKWVWEQGLAVFDDQDGSVRYLDGIITDITARKEMQKEQIILAEAVHQTDDLVLITSLNGAIEYANPAFERTTGYRFSEIAGKNPRILKSGKQPPEFYEQMWSTLLEGNVYRGRVVNKRKDSSEYIAQVTISPIRNELGELTNYVGVQQDVTHEIELEENLRQAQKLEAMGTLAGGVAHEINTPVQFVGNNLNFILESLPDLEGFVTACITLATTENELQGDELSELEKLHEENDIGYLLDEIPVALKQSQDGIEQIAKIVRSMKQFAHPGSEEMIESDLNDVLQNTVTVSRNEWKYVADIVFELDENLPEVPCHRSELSQVFLNLIVNAAQAIESTREGQKKGVIIIKTAVMDTAVRITIQDNGGGIPEHVQPRIFDPFFTTKAVGQGSGQGLAIAYTIIKDKHGGDITFDSEPGKGTTFSVILPVSSC